jgi:cellulose synthase/poly-beta-1,6-N-acetylglucosamine synthase-like glycosyltransferase
VVFWLGWEKSQPCQAENINQQPVSIILAVRNEEKNIVNLLTDISRQSYPGHLLEIIIVNDHSTDSTVSKVEAFASEAPFELILINLQEDEGKKAAINKGIKSSNNEIIITTDGDCRADSHWVTSMVACFDNKNIQLVSGPVRMYPQVSLWQRFQSIEFSSLISAGAATLSLGWPTMANGANLAYRKDAYTNIKGQSKQNISSGDDIFLLHEVSHVYSNAIVFCRDPRAIINTEPAKNLISFYHQRKRWAGKWQFYNNIPTILLAAFVFIVNLVVLSLPLLVLLGTLTPVLAANLFVVKLVFEFIFLREVQKFFSSRFLLHEFIILAIIYPAYVTFMALVGLIGKYKWKDRTTR